MKRILAAAVLFSMMLAAFTQEKIWLWPKKTGPGSEKVKIEQKEEERGGAKVHDRAISGVTQPYMEVYRPSGQSTGQAVLIIPGGTYQRVVYDKEGVDYVKAYNEAGITCFVLVYRTPNDGHKNRETVSLQDAQRAMRIIRSRAKEFGIDENKTGVMGSSAGGHVAASLATRYDEETYKADKSDKNKDGKLISAKPSFQILIYPVITMQDGGAHEGSRTSLLGEKPDQKAKDATSCELLVKEDTPIAFLCCAMNDKSVNPEGNILPYWKALRAANVREELHIFPASGHGFGVISASGTAAQWQSLSIQWLNTYVK
ncbi:MAG: alpha/beta hydrolase [Treponema sp.]|nr:alpha/beta hydrolase [Treponema sp.]